MRNAIHILRQSINMLLWSPSQAVRALWPALLAAIGFQFLAELSAAGSGTASAGNLIASAVLIVPTFVAVALVAIFWHRFALLSDDVRAAPWRGVSTVMVVRYLGQSLILAVILVLLSTIAFAAIAMFFSLVPLSTESGALAFVTILSLPIIFIVMYVALRLGLVFPATAVDSRMSIFESWAETTSISSELVWLVLFVSVLVIPLSLLQAPLGALGPLGSLINVVANTVLILISASILTTLYGLLVEKRDIPGVDLS